MMIIIVLLLVAIIIGLMFYNMSIHKKIDSFKNINQQITSLNVLQDFMDTISETSSVDDKLKKINDILIEKYGIKYSTILVYNKSLKCCRKTLGNIEKFAVRTSFCR